MVFDGIVIPFLLARIHRRRLQCVGVPLHDQVIGQHVRAGRNLDLFRRFADRNIHLVAVSIRVGVLDQLTLPMMSFGDTLSVASVEGVWA